MKTFVNILKEDETVILSYNEKNQIHNKLSTTFTNIVNMCPYKSSEANNRRHWLRLVGMYIIQATNSQF